MANYSPDNYIFHSIKNELKPTICESCRADGECDYGSCEKCRANQAFNRSYVETHLFEGNDCLEDYHSNKDIKSIVYRNENEHPYLYYGFELEVGFGDEIDEYDDYDEYQPAEWVCEMLTKFEHATGGLFASKERDGSLDNGIEFVSRPMSYAKCVDEDTIEKLKAGIAVLKDYGALDNQPRGHGMHVHISRKFFDYGATGQRNRDDAYKHMDWLFQFFQPELEKLCGREWTQYSRSKKMKLMNRINCDLGRSFSNSEMVVECSVKGKMKRGGYMANGDHENAVIISGPTIEGRIFHSTLDYEQILGNIEIMRAFAHAVRDGETLGRTFNDILHTKESKYIDKILQKAHLKFGDKFNADRVLEDSFDLEME